MRYYSLKLSATIFAIFLMQLVFPQITDNFKLVSADTFERPWTLITSIFLHANIAHLLLNLFGLALFGSILEAKIGGKKLLLLFFASGIFAGIIAAFFYSSALGASGAIFGIIGTLAVLRPMMVIWAAYMPMPMFVAAILWAIGDVFGYLFTEGTANTAHIAGLVLGVAFGFLIRKDYPEGRKEKRVALNIPKSRWEKWEEKHMLRSRKKQQ